MRFGYLRDDGHESVVLEAASAALEAAGCVRVIIEARARKGTAPGPALAALVGRLKAGDSIVAMGLDHVAGDVENLLDMLGKLSRAGIRLEALSGEIDTDNPAVGGAILSLSAFAERTARQAPTRRPSEPGGNPRGRPRRLIEVDLERARQLIEAGDKPIREVARELGVSRATLYRSLKQS